MAPLPRGTNLFVAKGWNRAMCCYLLTALRKLQRDLVSRDGLLSALQILQSLRAARIFPYLGRVDANRTDKLVLFYAFIAACPIQIVLQQIYFFCNKSSSKIDFGDSDLSDSSFYATFVSVYSVLHVHVLFTECTKNTRIFFSAAQCRAHHVSVR